MQKCLVFVGTYCGAIAYVAVAAGPEYYFIRCDNGDCVTELNQAEDSRALTIDCDDGDDDTDDESGEWSGSGTWSGTICGVEFGGG